MKQPSIGDAITCIEVAGGVDSKIKYHKIDLSLNPNAHIITPKGFLTEFMVIHDDFVSPKVIFTLKVDGVETILSLENNVVLIDKTSVISIEATLDGKIIPVPAKAYLRTIVYN